MMDCKKENWLSYNLSMKELLELIKLKIVLLRPKSQMIYIWYLMENPWLNFVNHMVFQKKVAEQICTYGMKKLFTPKAKVFWILRMIISKLAKSDEKFNETDGLLKYVPFIMNNVNKALY